MYKYINTKQTVQRICIIIWHLVPYIPCSHIIGHTLPCSENRVTLTHRELGVPLDDLQYNDTINSRIELSPDIYYIYIYSIYSLHIHNKNIYIHILPLSTQTDRQNDT